jgi:hypothetical protein
MSVGTGLLVGAALIAIGRQMRKRGEEREMRET